MTDTAYTIEAGLPFFEMVSETKTEWMEQRAGLVTATDMTLIYRGSNRAFESLYRRKYGGDNVFGGNQYTEWGHEREPIIADYVSEHILTGAAPNSNVCVNVGNQKFGATPDMIYVDQDSDEVITVQIKTTKNDWETLDNLPQGYFVQAQWEMLVCGAERCLYVWEPYEIVGETFVPGSIKSEVLVADPKFQAHLAETAMEFLLYSPPELEDVPDDFEAEVLLDRLIWLERQLKTTNAEVKKMMEERETVKAELLERLGGEERNIDYGNAVLTISPGASTSRFDRKSFAKEYPDLEKTFVVQTDPKPTVRVKLVDPGEGVSDEEVNW